jgi:hypothetical protein
MSVAIRSGELLACPVALRRAPLAVSVVSVRMRARGAVAVRAEATAEGVGKEGKKAAGKKKPASGITKPKPISTELREFVGGAAELPRTEAIKLVWAHIKGNNLQVRSPPLAIYRCRCFRAPSVCRNVTVLLRFRGCSLLATCHSLPRLKVK